MQSFDFLIQNAMILTMRSRNAVIRKGYLGIVGDEIAALGEGAPGEDLHACKVIEAHGGILLPGLVNGHTHASMSLFRGLADDLPLMEWLYRYIFPAESRMDARFVHTGALLACAEMIFSGTTTFCDMYLFEEEVAKAAVEAGMRCLVGEVLYDFPSPSYGPIQKGFEYAEGMIKTWRGHPLVSIAVEPHAVFTCSPDLLRAADRMAREHQVPLIIHVAETLSEVEQVLEKYGRRPLEHLDSLGMLGSHVIADHCVHLSREEISTLAERGVKVVTNPESNMKLASGVCPLPQLLAAGVTVGIGTDGCASNNNLDLFAEMDSAAKIHKVASLDPTVMDAFTVMKLATIDGARAIGMDSLIGTLEVGKKADIILVDIRKPHLTPMYDPYSHLVYSAKGSDVTHSFINGRPVMDRRRILTLDVEEVMERAKERAEDVRQWVLL